MSAQRARVGQVVPLAVSLTNEAAVQRAVEGADLVVNLVGILAESRPGDFQRVQADGAGRVARGDLVIIVAGSPPGIPGSTNAMRVHRIGDATSEVVEGYAIPEVD